jgi:peptidoglycan/xylan/chitin deacetylase (PgdA/CDA1 family)
MSQRGTSELRVALAGRNALLFVNFHHVREANSSDFPGLHHRSPQQLTEQVRTLARDFDFATPDAVREIIQGRRAIESNLCVLTFDDGLRDHHDHVAPVLGDLGLEGIFFVNTGPWEDGRLLPVHMAHLLSARYSYVELAADFERSAAERGLSQRLSDVPPESADTVYRYDDAETKRVKYYLNMLLPQEERSHVLRSVFARRIGSEEEHAQNHYLSPEMARELRRRGHAIGLHSHRHANLASESPQRRRRDLETNRMLLSMELGTAHGELHWISYPYGSPLSYDEHVVSDARAVGCDTGLTMRRGLNIPPDITPMKLQRVDTNDVVGGKSPLPWSQLIVELRSNS